MEAGALDSRFVGHETICIDSEHSAALSSLRPAGRVIVGCTALVLISAVIPVGRLYPLCLNSAASWPEPMAVLLTIVLTFYRRGHLLPAQPPHECHGCLSPTCCRRGCGGSLDFPPSG